MQMPGEKLVEKMWDSLVDKGIGSLLKPWQMRREGRAEIVNRKEEILLLAQAEHDASEIRAGKKKAHQDGKRVLLLEQCAEMVDGRAEPQLNSGAVLAAASQTKAAQAVLDEINVAKSILHAEDLLNRDDGSVSDEPLDADWLRNWRDGAARVSSDELQSLWGKILAGEVKTPGACSLRTLDFIRNLSQDEARQIGIICPYVSSGACIFNYGVVADRDVFKFEYFMFLEELGLINTGGGRGLTINYPSSAEDGFIKLLLFWKRALYVSAVDSKKTLTLSVYRVTPLGQQVFALNQSFEDEAYINEVGTACAIQGFDVEVCDYRHVDKVNINIFNNSALKKW